MKLKNKILETNLIYIDIFNNKKNIKKYMRVLDKVFKDLSNKISLKFSNQKYVLNQLIGLIKL